MVNCTDSFPHHCVDGTCAASPDECVSFLGCPLSRPIQVMPLTQLIAQLPGGPCISEDELPNHLCTPTQLRCFDGSCPFGRCQYPPSRVKPLPVEVTIDPDIENTIPIEGEHTEDEV